MFFFASFFLLENVNGEEQGLEMRQRRDGPKHHPDVGRNRGRGQSPGKKGHGPGISRSKSPHHPKKHGGKGKHGGSGGSKHGKKPGHGRRGSGHH